MVTSQEIKNNTSINGNVDKDKFMHFIPIVEITILEPILGTALLNKLKSDYDAESLAGDYLELHTNYIQPIIWHSIYAMYLRDSRVLAMNKGVYTGTAENAQISDLDEVKWSVKNAQGIADTYIGRLERYLCDVKIPEYELSQANDYDIDPRFDVDTKTGLWFGGIKRGDDYNFKYKD